MNPAPRLFFALVLATAAVVLAALEPPAAAPRPQVAQAAAPS